MKHDTSISAMEEHMKNVVDLNDRVLMVMDELITSTRDGDLLFAGVVQMMRDAIVAFDVRENAREAIENVRKAGKMTREQAAKLDAAERDLVKMADEIGMLSVSVIEDAVKEAGE